MFPSNQYNVSHISLHVLLPVAHLQAISSEANIFCNWPVNDSNTEINILNFFLKIQHSQINLPYIYCLHFFQPSVLVKPWRFRVHWEIRFIWKEEKNNSEKFTLGSRYKMWSGSQQTDDLLGRQLQKHPGDEWLWRNE